MMISTLCKKSFLSCIFLAAFCSLRAENQTAALTPVLPSTNLPFEISIELLDLSLPNGWHSGALGTYKGKSVLIAGRTNGLHGFSDDPDVNNFPPSTQNTVIYVVDFKHKKIWQRSLSDLDSGLTQEQIDLLSVTSPQFYQRGSTLYVSGGYGIDTATGEMNTKPFLSAIDLPGIIQWVIGQQGSASAHIRQTTHPVLQVTGGYMDQADSHSPTLLIFGQNFDGFYRSFSNGAYTEQVRKFRIVDDGRELYIEDVEELAQNPAFRRRDLNIVPVLHNRRHHLQKEFVVLSGVFTETGGIWTVPVKVFPDGNSFMPDPENPETFKQAMNNYACATAGLFSKKTKDMYILLFGGITFGFFQNGVFETDPEIPFTNEVTTIKIDKHFDFSQYIMANQYPEILSTYSNPGNVLLFGAGAEFVSAKRVQEYRRGVLALDCLSSHKPTVIGYIIGGIQSTLPNTNSNSDSAASPYIFRVILHPI